MARNPKINDRVRRQSLPRRALVALTAGMALIGVAGQASPASFSQEPPDDKPSSQEPSSQSAPLDDSVFERLDQMAEAIRTEDFEGTFVYQSGDSLAAMRIVHRYRHGESQDSLLTLNGPLHTVGRSGKAVACLLSGGQAVLLDRAGQQRLDQRVDQAVGHEMAQRQLPKWRQLREHYRFLLRDESRVAGRGADVIDIVPKDTLRYGYRFSIDQTSFLPLSAALIDAEGHPLQQLMFTELSLVSPQPDAQPSASAGHPDHAQPDPSRPSAPARPPSSLPLVGTSTGAPDCASRWKFSSLPSGFELAAHEWIDTPDEGEAGEYFLLSDGLASMSLYIEPAAHPGLIGETRIAAIHAVGQWVNGFQMTVVGEVPAATAEAVLGAVTANMSPACAEAGERIGVALPSVPRPTTGEQRHD